MKVSVGVLLLFVVVGTKAQVSSKLDLDDESKESTGSKLSSRSHNNSTSHGKVSPKIEGVRVTVDTGDGKKIKETESKESVEIVDNKNTKRVGIHTDITFEITDDKVDTNATSREQSEHDHDASVPIFKGRTTTRRPHIRLPYNPKIHIDYPGQPTYNHHGNGRDRYNGHNIPVYPGTQEDVYRTVDRWSNVIPIPEIWTTERSSYYIPSRSQHRQDFESRSYNQGGPQYRNGNQQQHHQQPPFLDGHQTLGGGHGWQPCVCISDDNNSSKRKDTSSFRSFRSVGHAESQKDEKHGGHGVSSKIRI